MGSLHGLLLTGVRDGGGAAQEGNIFDFILESWGRLVVGSDGPWALD